MSIDLDGFTRIAITGKMRSGKSEIASILTSDYGFEKVSFADPLKRLADDMFRYLYEPIYAPCPFSDDGKRIVDYRKPRKLLQELGQSMRAIDEDVWIKKAEATVEALENYRSTQGIVIDDLRQPNEEIWCRNNGFTIIRVNADEGLRAERADVLGDKYSADDMRHDTEQHVDSFAVDYEINNNGDKEELRRKVDEVMNEIIPTP